MCCVVYKFTVHCIVYSKLLSLTSYKFTLCSLQLIATDQSVSTVLQLVYFLSKQKSFSTCAITKIIAQLSMGVNVLTLNKYMIIR